MVKTRRNRSRKQRRSQRRSQRSQRSQRGGGCAAQYNRNSFGQNGGGGCAAPYNRSQNGGALAEFSTGDATLLDSAGMTHAQTAQQFNDITGLASVIPRQTGGSRRSQRGGMDSVSGSPPLFAGMQVGGMDSFSGSPPLLAGMQVGASRRRKNRKSRKQRRRQRGGMMEMKEAFTAPPVMAGTSFMKMDDASLGYGFNPMKGAQA